MNDVSPITRVPAHWKTLRFHEKRLWLIGDGQARDVLHASSLLSRHGHAARARRQMKKGHRKFVKAALELTGATRVGAVTVKAACMGCATIVYEKTQFADGHREHVELVPYKQTKFSLLCEACLAKASSEPILARDAECEEKAA